jgi:hypothetical protein
MGSSEPGTRRLKKMAKKIVYVVTTGKHGRQWWSRVGVAFVNRDGSMNVKLMFLPIDGELHIRDEPPKADGDRLHVE